MSLDEILKSMAQHSRENPTHGSDCACKDNMVGEARRNLLGYSGDNNPERAQLRQELALLTRYILR